MNERLSPEIGYWHCRDQVVFHAILEHRRALLHEPRNARRRAVPFIRSAPQELGGGLIIVEFRRGHSSWLGSWRAWGALEGPHRIDSQSCGTALRVVEALEGQQTLRYAWPAGQQ